VEVPPLKATVHEKWLRVFPVRERLSSKYADLAEQLINMALESTDYDEERAGQILNLTKEGSRAQSGVSRQSCR